MSPSSIRSGSSPRAGRLQLAAVLAQLRRDELHAEPLVDLLLGRVGVGLAARVVGDPVLAHVQPALTASVRSASLCLPEPGEVLQQVAERLLRHHAQVDRNARVRHGPRAGDAGGVHRVDLGKPLEGLDEGRRVAVAATTSRSLHESAIRRALPASSTRVAMGAQRRRLFPRPPPAPGRAGSASGARRKRPPPVLRHVLLRLGAEARHVREPAVLDRAPQVVQGGDLQGARAARAPAWGRDRGSG